MVHIVCKPGTIQWSDLHLIVDSKLICFKNCVRCGWVLLWTID